MAKIIEIAGPAGVGKTTILKGLIKKRNESDKWVLNQTLYPYQKLNPLKISSVTQNLPSLIQSGKTSLDHRLLYDIGRNFIIENSDYIDAYWNNLHQNYSRDLNGFDSRFDSAAKFYSKIQKYQYIKEYFTPKFVLFDEGLIHDLGGRVPIQNSKLNKSLDDIDTLLPLMPLPAMLILIDSDIDTILKRLATRAKVLQGHKQKSELELRDLTLTVKSRMHYIQNKLQEMGVTVLTIDSKDEVDANTKKITQFINQHFSTINV